MPNHEEIDPMLTTGEVARLLNVHINTVRRWSNQGVLRTFRLGARGDRRFHREDIVNLLESDPMLTATEVARLLNVHINTVRRWSDHGLLGTYRIGTRGDRRFNREDVINFLSQQSNKIDNVDTVSAVPPSEDQPSRNGEDLTASVTYKKK